MASAPSKELWVRHLSTSHLVYGNNSVLHQSLSFLTRCSTSLDFLSVEAENQFCVGEIHTYQFIFISMGSSSQVWPGGPWDSFGGSIKSKLFSWSYSNTLFRFHSHSLKSERWSFPDITCHDDIITLMANGQCTCVLGFKFSNTYFCNFLDSIIISNLKCFKTFNK